AEAKTGFCGYAVSPASPGVGVAASPEARMIAAPCFRTVKRWGPYCGDCSIFLRLEELGHPSAPTRRRQTTGRDWPTSTVCAAPIAGAPGRRQRTPFVADGPPVHRSSKSTRPREHRPINMGSLSWRACSPRDTSLSIIGFEDEMTWSRPGSDDRREPRASSRHLWHLRERVRASS